MVKLNTLYLVNGDGDGFYEALSIDNKINSVFFRGLGWRNIEHITPVWQDLLKRRIASLKEELTFLTSFIETPSTPSVSNRFWLYYNENNGTFRIVEVGKTLTVEKDDADFKKVGGSPSFDDLKTFVLTLNLISATTHNGIQWYYKRVVEYFNKRFDTLQIDIFENDF